MAFQKPRILSDSEVNVIRGKCLVAAASAEELMQLIGHFDLVDQKLRSALTSLSGCLPDKVYIYGPYGEYWKSEKPDSEEFEIINFSDVLSE